MHKLTIIPITFKKDLNFVFESQKETFSLSYGRYPSSKELYNLKFKLLSTLKNEKTIVKFCYLRSFKIGYYWCRLTSSEVFILDIFIIKPYRKFGFGQQVLKDIYSVARAYNLKMVRLACSQLNKNAITFFFKNGFLINKFQMRENIMWYELSRDLSSS